MNLEHVAALQPKTNIPVKKKSNLDDFRQGNWEDVCTVLAKVNSVVASWIKAKHAYMLVDFAEIQMLVRALLQQRYDWARRKANFARVDALIGMTMKFDIAGQRCIKCQGKGVRYSSGAIKPCGWCKGTGRIIYTYRHKAEDMGISPKAFSNRWAARERAVLEVLREWENQVERQPL